MSSRGNGEAAKVRGQQPRAAASLKVGTFVEGRSICDKQVAEDRQMANDLKDRKPARVSKTACGFGPPKG